MIRVLVSIVSAAGLALVGVAALLPSSLHVERSIVVPAGPHAIQPLLSNLPERARWIPWTESDPDATYRYGGVPGAIGSTMAWEGPKIGAAVLTLTSVDPGAEVVTRLAYREPMAMTTTDRFVLEPIDADHTRVRWINEGPLPFGPARVFGVFADGLLGPDYERGLARLALQFSSTHH